MLAFQQTNIDKHALMLERAKNGKRLKLRLRSQIVAVPDPRVRSWAEREERFFAASPDDPDSYVEKYDDIFDDDWKHKRTEAEIQDRIKAETDSRQRRDLTRSYKQKLYYRSKDMSKSSYYNYDDDYSYYYEKDDYYDYKYRGMNARKSKYTLKEAEGMTPLIDFEQVINTIEENIAPRESIRAIVLLGSAAKMVEHINIGKNMLGMRSAYRDHLEFNKEIHDVDLLVLLDPKTDKKVGKLRATGTASQQESDGYGVYTSTRFVAGLYDIFAVTADEYEASLHRGDFMTEHVAEQGVLLLGSFPYPTSGTEITWTKSGKSRWKPQRVVSKMSIEQRKAV